jgi:nucleosome binding factor SPN SPT16 subunit
LLLSLQAELLAFIKDGVSARDVYQRALNYVKEKNPELEKFFVKNVGFSVRLSRVLLFLLFTVFQDRD